MSEFPAQLDQVFFTRFAVFANPEWVAEKYDSPPVQDSRLNVAAVPTGKGAWLATQIIKHDGVATNSPYSLDIECIGTMHFVDDYPAEKQHSAATQLAHNVLYAACREAILAATGRQPWGPYTLGFSVLQLKPDAPPEAKAKAKAKTKE